MTLYFHNQDTRTTAAAAHERQRKLNIAMADFIERGGKIQYLSSGEMTNKTRLPVNGIGGVANPASKLNHERAAHIRQSFVGVTDKQAIGELSRKLAEQYGVTTQSIYSVRTGRTWS